MGKHPVVEALKTEVSKNPVFRDICYMFSQRQRTRGRLTVTRLKQAMEQEGFNYTRKQYEDVLRFLGKVGLGTLDFSKRGKVRSLNGLKIKLQSIGLAALNTGTQLENRTLKNNYQDLTVPNSPETVLSQHSMHQNEIVDTPRRKTVRTKTAADVAPVRKEEFPVFLTMIIGGKMVNIPYDKKISPENMGEFISEFKKIDTEL